ncbi:MAG: hypothetical protein Q9172_000192 [Xanthocarpia lactea]
MLTLSQGKRLLIKDMAYYLVPPNAVSPCIAPSLGRVKRGVGTIEPVVNGATNGTTKAPYPFHTDAEPNNPTVIPRDTLGNFHFTFLIRHPRSSIPSYYRCCVPPLDRVTGFYDFMPSEAGYDELRRLFDYLRSIGQVGPASAGQTANGRSASNGDHFSNGFARGVEVCVIDADDLLDNPAGIVEAFCKSTGIDFTPDMLDWSTEADHQQAAEAFSKWKKKVKSVEEENSEWAEKYGEKAAQVIRETVDANLDDYEYLKQFAIKV